LQLGHLAQDKTLIMKPKEKNLEKLKTEITIQEKRSLKVELKLFN